MTAGLQKGDCGAEILFPIDGRSVRLRFTRSLTMGDLILIVHLF